ncbi:MAG: cysteine hydrolase [Bacilli bacterium]|jgi:nicotinamidase-related amidase|nr:cysteine hydrolase [Bacilli bacterium]
MKRLLVVVDFQNDFVDGPLGFPKAASFYPRVKELISEFEDSRDEVVFTRDVREDDYLHTEEGRNLPIPHCLRGTPGARFYGDLEEMASAHRVFEKGTFGSEALLDYLKKGAYREIVLCGLDLSICVIANAIIAKTAAPNAHIVVDLSASGSGDREAEGHAIAALRRLEIETIDGTSKKGIIF